MRNCRLRWSRGGSRWSDEFGKAHRNLPAGGQNGKRVGSAAGCSCGIRPSQGGSRPAVMGAADPTLPFGSGSLVGIVLQYCSLLRSLILLKSGNSRSQCLIISIRYMESSVSRPSCSYFDGVIRQYAAKLMTSKMSMFFAV